MIEDKTINSLNYFFRKEKASFSLSKLKKLLASLNILVTIQELREFMSSHPNVCKLNDNLYVTRAGCFTGRTFSIQLTKFEIEQGILIPGHRCMPFVDSEIFPHEISFSWNNEILKQKIVTCPMDEVFPHYSLYGEEFFPQYLALDPANKEKQILNNGYELSSYVDITVVDIKSMLTQTGFIYGDRLILYVIDWDKSIVHLEPKIERKKNVFTVSEAEKERKRWYKNAEKKLVESFLENGPTISIENQLSLFFIDNMCSLVTKNPGSIEELLEESRNIDIVEYGVESRLWIKDEVIPVVGNWCFDEPVNNNAELGLYDICGIAISDDILDAYIHDGLYKKKSSPNEIFSNIIFDESVLTSVERKLLLLHIKQRHDIISKQYNRFADYEIGELRHSTLNLYSRVLMLVCELDRCQQPVQSLPQNEIVILSQLFGHTGKIIESISYQENVTAKDIDSLRLSLEGMEFAFSEIEGLLKEAVEENIKCGFKVFKKEERDKDE